MKFIERLYSVRYDVMEYREDNYGERVGLKTEIEEFEFNQNDAISSYVSHSEDGNYCGYEAIEEGISNSIRALDEIMGYQIRNYVCSILQDKPKEMLAHYNTQIETIKSCIEIVFEQTKVKAYDIEKRYLEYYKHHLEQNK